MANYTKWYRVGSISVTNGSPIIVGKNTFWADAGLNPGDIVKINNVDYELDSISDASHITLTTNFTGNTANNLPYAIIRNFTANSELKIVAQTANLLNMFERYLDLEMQTLTGKSAFELAQDNGYTGTITQWLASLIGKSAYEVAKANGYTGTQAQWLESLKAAGEWSALDTRMLSLEDSLEGLLDVTGSLTSEGTASIAHNALYRQRNLGKFTEDLSAKIKKGNFHDIYPGDRFNITIPAYSWVDGDGITHDEQSTAIEFIVAGVDLFFIRGTFTHHIVVIPRYPLYTHIWNKSGDRLPYYSSYIRTSGLNRARAIFNAAFGEEHIVKYREALVNAMDSTGTPTGYIDLHGDNAVDIELMSECMVFGGWQAGKRRTENSTAFFNSVMASQFPVFRHNPALQNYTNVNTEIQNYWLRDMLHATAACLVYPYGTTPGSMHITWENGGVRPFALIS